MITKFDKFLNESPDHINIPNPETGDEERLNVEDSDAVAFTIETNDDHTKVETIYVSETGNYHNGYIKYPGRLWKDSKLITFWVYPNPILFKNIIEHLEEKLNIQIFNNGWKVEVVKNNTGDIATKEVKPGENYKYSNVKWENSEFVPVEEYIGSDDQSDLQKQMHLMGWAEKQRLKEKCVKLAPGFGADRTAWDQPRNLKYRQSIYQEKKKN